MKLPGLPGDGTPLAAEVDRFAEVHRLERRAAEIDRSAEFPRAEFAALGKAGLLGLRIPARWGGRELELTDAASALFRLAYRGGTAFAKLSLQPEFSSVLADHGAPALAESFFSPLVRGELLIGNQVTEPGAGSDAGAISLTARRDGATFVLTGTKSEAAFAEDATVAIVYARSRPDSGAAGLSAFLVDQSSPGVERTVVPDLGERWMRRGRVQYDGVRVPADRLIGEEGKAFEYLRPELTRERALLAAVYLGVARSAWEATVRHVGERKAFGRRLADQEGVSFPLVEAWAHLDATWLYLVDVLGKLTRGESAVGPAALAKWMATTVALETIDRAIQYHGGRGYSAQVPFERMWRDVRSGAIAHGPSEIMHVVAARQLWE